MTDLIRTPLQRRSTLLAPLAGGLAWLAGGLSKPAAAQEKASLIAKRVDRVPEDPADELWQSADLLAVPLAPQAVVKPRIYETGVTAITARALYDADRLAFLLSWTDAERNVGIDGVAAFRDAIALEFPADPANGIPYFGMGEPNKPVTIYQWKADWEFGRDSDVDQRFPGMVVDWYPLSGRGPGEIAAATDYGTDQADKAFDTSWWAGNSLGDPILQARTSVEKLWAEGFGSLTAVDPDRQDGTGRGTWAEGGWSVVVSMPRAQDLFMFEPGMTLPVAFAAWDGAKGERGGEKGVSTWYFVSLEQPVGSVVYWAPALALVGAVVAQTGILRHVRRRARTEDEAGGASGEGR